MVVSVKINSAMALSADRDNRKGKGRVLAIALLT